MTKETRVLYNADCPVCSYEIDHYARHAQQRALPIRFDDLNSDALSEWDLTEDEAARRLYVLKDDVLLSGVPAFLVLWDDMPRYRWLARLVRMPGVFQISVALYDRVVAPLIYKRHRRRVTQRETQC